MQRVSSGYTILEVLIFLAISVAFLGSVMNLIRGRQAEVDFDQKMRDTQSKIQSWINESTAGFTGSNPAAQSCIITGGRPQLQNVPPSATYAPNCVYLGKAIQFTDISNGGQPDKIFAYSVFGVRLNGGELPSNLKDSSPEPAVQSGATDLTQALDLSPAEVKTVVSNAVGSAYTTSHLVGFFNSLNTEANTTDNGQTDINAYQFRFNGTPPTPADLPGGNSLINCMELTGGTCFPPSTDKTNWPEKLNSLKVCLTDGRRTAQITINSSAGVGATVKLDFVNC